MTATEAHIDAVTQRLMRVLSVHCDPDGGSAFWIERCAERGIDPSQIRAVDDLPLLGEMTPGDLASRPLLDFIPRRFHRRLDRFTIGQTGGTTAMGRADAGDLSSCGFGAWAAFRDDEFEAAFVSPFAEAAAHVGFPMHEPWLFVGPSGPHVIGKAVPRLAAALGSHDPFSVDFDPRWVKRLPSGSFAMSRYLQHVIEQAVAVIRTQSIGVLFTTPPVLEALAQAMTPAQRDRIRGVHYGGLPVSCEQLRRFQVELFRNAVHLCGYGNTLLGCCLELNSEAGRSLDYFPMGGRLLFEVIDEHGSPLPTGRRGQVRVTRLDESMLIVRMRERDCGELVPPPAHAPSEFFLPGIRDPHAAPSPTAPPAAAGLY